MAIANCKKMLMIGLANVWCQNEIVLVFLVYIVNAESFPGRVRESCYHVVLDYLRVFLCRISFYNERILCVVLYAIGVIYALVLERRRLGNAWNQSLNRSSHRIIIHGQLVLYERTRVRIARRLFWTLRVFFSRQLLLLLLARFLCLLLGVHIRMILGRALGLILLLLFGRLFVGLLSVTAHVFDIDLIQ